MGRQRLGQEAQRANMCTIIERCTNTRTCRDRFSDAMHPPTTSRHRPTAYYHTECTHAYSHTKLKTWYTSHVSKSAPIPMAMPQPTLPAT